jgi:hypothetical protein
LKPVPTKKELKNLPPVVDKKATAAENEKKDPLKQQAQPSTQVKRRNVDDMSQKINALKKAFGSGKNVSRYSDTSDDEASDSSDYQF